MVSLLFARPRVIISPVRVWPPVLIIIACMKNRREFICSIDLLLTIFKDTDVILRMLFSNEFRTFFLAFIKQRDVCLIYILSICLQHFTFL